MCTVLQHCSTCGDEREFEIPPCPDGHGLDCPELICLECGTAMYIGFVVPAQPRPVAVGNAA